MNQVILVISIQQWPTEDLDHIRFSFKAWWCLILSESINNGTITQIKNAKTWNSTKCKKCWEFSTEQHMKLISNYCIQVNYLIKVKHISFSNIQLCLMYILNAQGVTTLQGPSRANQGQRFQIFCLQVSRGYKFEYQTNWKLNEICTKG